VPPLPLREQHIEKPQVAALCRLLDAVADPLRGSLGARQDAGMLR
jgi:hypothetical protein